MKHPVTKIFSLLLVLALLLTGLTACSGTGKVTQQDSSKKRATTAVQKEAEAVVDEVKSPASVGVSKSATVRGVCTDVGSSQFTLQAEGGKTMHFNSTGVNLSRARGGLQTGRAYTVSYRVTDGNRVADAVASTTAKYNNQNALDDAGSVMFAVDGAVDLGWFSALCSYPLTVGNTTVTSAADLQSRSVDAVLPPALRDSVTATDLFNLVPQNGKLLLRHNASDPSITLSRVNGRWKVTSINY